MKVVLVTIYSESQEVMQLLSQCVADYMMESKSACHINPIRSYTSAISTEFTNFRKSDYCLIDFSNPKNAISLVAKLVADEPSLFWICANASQQLLLDMLVLRPSGYMPNARNLEQCRKEIRRVDSYVRKLEQKRFFTFKYEGEYKRISFNDISYFESSAKKVALVQHSSPTKYYFTAKLDDIQKQVPTFFLRCHQSFLVNMNCIRFFDVKNKLIIAMPNEEVLVSRRSFTEAKHTYETYVENNKQ